jgi:ADP-heptose:LPS heptosyltransferase
MKKIGGMHLGLYGDIAMSTFCAEVIKKHHPDSVYTAFVGKSYKEIAPLLLNHASIDSIHICDSPKDAFSEKDLEWIAQNKFDAVFNPMQDHDHSYPWWMYRHQVLETAFMHGIPIDGEIGKINLNRWFDAKDNSSYIAFAPFPAFYAGLENNKALKIARAQEIVDLINSLGYKVLQVGHPNEPTLEWTYKCNTDYFGSVKEILGCKMMIMGDSGLNWVLSGYDFPLIGLYSNDYYGLDYIKNIQPINKNAIYLSERNLNEIPIDSIEKSIKTLL